MRSLSLLRWRRWQQACAERMCASLVGLHTGVVSRLYGLESQKDKPAESPAGQWAAKASAAAGNPASRYLIVK